MVKAEGHLQSFPVRGPFLTIVLKRRQVVILNPRRPNYCLLVQSLTADAQLPRDPRELRAAGNPRY